MFCFKNNKTKRILGRAKRCRQEYVYIVMTETKADRLFIVSYMEEVNPPGELPGSIEL